jgi:hypothetical protein
MYGIDLFRLDNGSVDIEPISMFFSASHHGNEMFTAHHSKFSGSRQTYEEFMETTGSIKDIFENDIKNKYGLNNKPIPYHEIVSTKIHEFYIKRARLLNQLKYDDKFKWVKVEEAYEK